MKKLTLSILDDIEHVFTSQTLFHRFYSGEETAEECTSAYIVMHNKLDCTIFLIVNCLHCCPAQLLYKRRLHGRDFREIQLLREQQGRSDPLTSSAMLSAVLLLGLAAATFGAPGGGRLQYGYKPDNCHTQYTIKVESKCHQEYVTECSNVVNRYCNGHGKREAEAEPIFGGLLKKLFKGPTRPVCQKRVERQCRKVARQVCVPVEVKVPYQVCSSSHVARQSQGYRH